MKKYEWAKKIASMGCILTMASALIVGCSSDSNNASNAASADEVKAHYVNMAYAVYSDSLETALDLQEAIDAFLLTPTALTHQAAKDAYKAARKPYQQSEIMRWDESITGATDLSADGGIESVDAWEGQVNAWPLDETLIEHMINETGDFSGGLVITKQALVDNFEKDGNEANVTTGVHAIEFMLWDKDTSGPAKGPGLRSHTEFDCDDSDDLEDRNCQYLKAAVDLLVDDLTAMKAEWSPAAAQTQGTLAYNYLNSNEAIDYMAQALASMAVGELGGARLSAGMWRPGLLSSDPVKVGDYEEEHDCFSDLSHVAVYYNFVGVMNSFYGEYEQLDGTVISGPGLGDYVRSRNGGLYNDLDEVLQAASVHMETIFDLGEDQATSYDTIIAQSETYYVDDSGMGLKPAGLLAVEGALDELAKVEEIIHDIKDVLSLDAVDPDAIGETD